MTGPVGVYRSEQGRIWRVLQAADGGIRVEVLENNTWVAGPVRLVGLRLSPTTKRLSDSAISKLPK